MALELDPVGHEPGHGHEAGGRTFEAFHDADSRLEPRGLRVLRRAAECDSSGVIACSHALDGAGEQRGVLRTAKNLRRRPADELVGSQAQDFAGGVGCQPDGPVEVMDSDEVGEGNEHRRELEMARKRPRG